jgi:hypothetical protein
MSTFNLAVAYVEESCCRDGCGISFALNRDHYNKLQANKGTTFYCPNGHAMHYTGKSDEQKLRDAEAREIALRDQLGAAIRDGEATKAALLRDRARFAAGVCPCCNRTFENVRRHMVAKHPDYDVTRVERHQLMFKCSCGRKFETYKGLRIHQGRSRETSGNFAWDSAKTSKHWAHLTEVKV